MFLPFPPTPYVQIETRQGHTLTRHGSQGTKEVQHRQRIDLVESIELPDDLIRFRRQAPLATDNTVPPNLIIDARRVMLSSLYPVTLLFRLHFSHRYNAQAVPRALTLRGLLVLDILNTLLCRTQAGARSVVIGVGIHLQTRLDERLPALKTDRRCDPPRQRRAITWAGEYINGTCEW